MSHNFPEKRTYDYHLTVTMKPVWYKLTPKEQYVKSMVELNTLLRDYQKTCVPELTKQYNIHWHCMISSKTDLHDYTRKPFEYYIHQIFRNNSMFGYIKVDKIEHESEYITYMLKDLITTCNILDMKVCLELDDYKLDYIYTIPVNDLEDYLIDTDEYILSDDETVCIDCYKSNYLCNCEDTDDECN